MFTPLLDNQHFEYSVGKILCIGRNYAAHAAELNNPVPDTPVLFLKPSDAACDLRQPIVIPENKGSVHHELELAILIGRRLTHATPEQVQAAVAGGLPSKGPLFSAKIPRINQALLLEFLKSEGLFPLRDAWSKLY